MKRLRFPLFAVVASVFFLSTLSLAEEPGSTSPPSSPLPGPTDPKELQAFLDGVIQVEMKEEHIPGVVFSAVKDGVPFFSKGYGYADADKHTPVDPAKTLFLIASVSKLVNATAVMQLRDLGKLDLNADVNTYLTTFKIPATYAQPITLTNLLTHTAGYDDRGLSIESPTRDTRLSLGTYLAMYMPRRVMPPGEFLSYSNHGAALSGYVVELVSGQPFAHYVEDHIYKPLNMTHSSFDAPPSWDADMATGYAYKGSLKKERFGFLQPIPAGAMVSTADDIAHFMIAHLEHGSYNGAQILSPETTEEMHRIHFTHDDRLSGGIAIGFFRRTVNEQTVLEHGGDFPGYASHLVLFPAQRFGYFMSCNIDDEKLRQTVFKQITDRYFPRAKDQKPPAPPADFNQRVSKYTGFYRNNRYSRLTIEKLTTLTNQLHIGTDGEGHLMFPRGSDDAGKLVEVGSNLFQDTREGTRIAFRTNTSGAVTNLVTGGAAWDKLQWYEEAPVQFLYVGLLMLIFLWTAVGWPLAMAVRMLRGRKRPSSGITPTLLRLLAWAVAVANAAMMLFLVYTLMTVEDSEFITGIPQRIVFVLYIPLLTCPLAVFLFLSCPIVWRKEWWGFWRRTQFSLLATALVGFIPFLWYWNLLGFHFK